MCFVWLLFDCGVCKVLILIFYKYIISVVVMVVEFILCFDNLYVIFF